MANNKKSANGKSNAKRRLRSRDWFDAPGDPTMAALYLERYMNFGLTLAELHSGRPIIGIAQTGSDLSPCNRHHIDLAVRVRDGIRDAGGIPIEFPVHPIQETGKRPTAALDRNLAYLSLVECLYGYFFDGVVLTTGCDKTTPAMIMGAATVNIPAIVLSGGPMLDGHFAGGLAGSGTIVWYARQELAAGRIDLKQFLEMVASSAPSVGHCNTMGTALSMNSMAEALGLSLTGCAAIPGPYRERGQIAYETGKRIVDMVWEDLKPSDVLTRKRSRTPSWRRARSAPDQPPAAHQRDRAPHRCQADNQDWDRIITTSAAGTACRRRVSRRSLHRRGRADGDAELSQEEDPWRCAHRHRQDHGESQGRQLADGEVIKTTTSRCRARPGFAVLSGNLFDSAIMKTSVISPEFRKKYLERKGDKDAFEGTAIVFDGPDYHHHQRSRLPIDENASVHPQHRAGRCPAPPKWWAAAARPAGEGRRADAALRSATAGRAARRPTRRSECLARGGRRRQPGSAQDRR
jgi:dihydroxy-acid dehydratase